MTDWTTHRCKRTHATAKGFLRCKYPAAKWITGTGDWALVSWCGRAATFTLWPSLTEARDRDSVLFATGCGTYCRGKHEVIHINLNRNPAPASPAALDARERLMTSAHELERNRWRRPTTDHAKEASA